MAVDSNQTATLAHRESKGNGEDRHDEGDEGIGELALELHAEADGVEAGAAEIGDVFIQLGVAHLVGELVLLLEVAGLLANLWECGAR